jgi:hypothetical protein
MEDLALTFPYTATDLTDQINVIPNRYGLMEELNLFPAEGSTSTIVEMRYENKTLRVLPAKERGSPSTPMLSETGQTIFIEIPHFPAQDLITPKDLQDILVVAQRTKRRPTLAEEVSKRLLSLRNTHAITREWVRASALQGIITDGNGAVVANLNQIFGINPVTIDFVLGTAGTDVIAKCQQVWQSISTNLQGETMRAIEVIVGPTFFGELIEHPNVAKYWLQAEQATSIANMIRVERQGQMWGREFYFQNLLFREYYGTAPIKSGSPPTVTSTAFFPNNGGTAYPVGTMNMFRTYDGPANDLRFLGEIGQEIYVSPKFLDHGKGIELESESNPLAVCRRPGALVQITTSN